PIPVLQSVRIPRGGTLNVSMSRAVIKASVVVALTSVPLLATYASGQSATDPAGTGAQTASVVAAPQPTNERYRDGIVIWETADDAAVPFLLKFNINTQLRYLNTQDSDESFTD